MSDNEIIKALECCKSRECSECKRIDSAIPEECECRLDLMEKLYTLINRQKAEIDRLQKLNNELHKNIRENATNELHVMLGEVRFIEAEAIKEFADKYEKAVLPLLTSAKLDKKDGIYACLDILKEMAGDGDA